MKFAEVGAYACLTVALACGRPTGIGQDQSSAAQKLPFDHAPQAGISPTHSIVPSATRIPAGTEITISLEHSLSSVSAHANDTFTAMLEEPVVINGQTLVAAGAAATGTVLDARSAAPHSPGYVRIALTTLSVNGKPLPIATSSLFAKAGSRDDRGPAAAKPLSGKTPASKEITFAPGRRLSFRLTQDLELQ